MIHLGRIDAEGGPLLIMDADGLPLWEGSGGNGTDYQRACQLFDKSPSLEGTTISIGNKAGMLWEMKGAGTADVFTNDHLVVTRTWPTNSQDNTIPQKLAAQPLAICSELGQIQIATGTLVVLWAAENGSNVRPLNGSSHGGQARALPNTFSGLIVQAKSGTYRCFHDQLETSFGAARRVHLFLV